MAEELDEEAEAAAKAKKKKKKMIIGLLLVVGLAYQFVLKKPPPPEDEAMAEEVEVVIEEGEIAPMGELVVNLADVDQIHYLRLSVAAVLNAEFTLELIEPQLPKVSDVIIDTVSAKTFAELRETGATVKLKEEISLALQDVFEEGEIVRVIFTTFVMQ